jgi:hypothetical protein
MGNCCCELTLEEEIVYKYQSVNFSEAQQPYKQTTEIETSQELVDRIKQVGMFKFKITGLLTLHNYICTAREKKDVHNLLIFDISESKPIS